MKANVAAIFLLAMTGEALFAHSGGKDANGCHTNSKTGDYHCHGTSNAVPASTSSRSPERDPAKAPEIRRATGKEIESVKRALGSLPPPPEQQIERLEFAPPTKPPADGFEVVRPTDKQLIELAQTLLRGLGYEIADKNGELGYVTIVAIREFQSKYELRPDGRVSPLLLLKLSQTLQSTCRR